MCVLNGLKQEVASEVTVEQAELSSFDLPHDKLMEFIHSVYASSQ